MTNWTSALRLGARTMRQRPVLALGAVLSLALGIGANTAAFSVLHRVVLNPLPYGQPEQLVVVWETSPDDARRPVAPANFVDWRRRARSFVTLAAFDAFRPTMTQSRGDGGSEPEVVRAVGASGSFFSTLGVSAAVGRTLVADDDLAGAEAVAVISHGLWRRAFGSAPDVLGRSLALDGRPHVIVGIMWPEFLSPLQAASVDVWVNGDRGVPRTFPFAGDVTAIRDAHILLVVGRLHANVSRTAAQQELTAIMQDLAREHPDSNSALGANVTSLHDAVVGDAAQLAGLLQLAVAMMLLIACANVAHLLLGQATARQAEIATRVALGAGRGRIVQQFLAESLVIAVPAGVLGVALAVWGLELLVAAAPVGLPRLDEIAIDRVVLVFSVTLTFSTVVVFGLGPALQAFRTGSLTPSQSTTRVAGGHSVGRWHQAVVIGELASAQVLLVAAALLITSFLAAQHVALGYVTEGRVAADLNLAPQRYLIVPRRPDGKSDTTAKEQFVTRVLHRVRSLPGVRAAAASFTSPLAGAPNRGIVVEGRPASAPGRQDTADFQVVTPEFFRAVGATLTRGRHFTERDTATTPPVAIVNQAFVDAYVGGLDPIGRRLEFGGGLSHQIVGVVGDMRYRSVEAAADPTFYLPLTQNTEGWPFLSFVLWTTDDQEAAMTALRSAIREADPQQAVVRVRTFDEILRTALAPRRFNTWLVGAFAAAALLLASVGTYGVLSFAVTRRRRELGVRAALGASPGMLRRLVLREAGTITVLALTAGTLAAIALTHLMQTMLFGVAARDPRAFAAVAALLAAVALIATWLPARRATAIDPAVTLREG